MIKQAYMMAMALVLAAAAGSAEAGGKLGGGMDKAGDGGNGVQLNGIPASGLTIETVRLPDGSAQVTRQGGVDRNDVQLAEIRGSGLIRTTGGRWGNGVQLNGIPASGFAVETLELPDGAVVVDRSGYEARASRSTASSSAHCWPWTRWRCPIAQR